MRWCWLLPILILAACGAPSAGDGKAGPGGHGEETHEVEAVTVVEVVELTTGDVSDILVTSAVVESEAEANLFPIATGIVVSVHKDEGDVVHKGDVLAVIDNASLDAGAERSHAELERIEKDYARLSELYGQGAISQREFTEAGYSLKAARTSAREASRTQGQTRITSPLDGVVAARDIRVGEFASSGRRAFQVVDLEALRVVAALPEREVARIAIGQTARLISAYDEEVWAPGVVERIAPVVDATSGTFRVTVGVDASQTALRPGQYVSVELEVGRHEGVLVAHRKAVIFEDGLPVVYRMIEKPEAEEAEEGEEGEEGEGDAEGGGWFAGWGFSFGAGEESDDAAEDPEAESQIYVAERVLVAVGLMDDSSAEIESGLALGDQIIVVGQSNLKDGAVVRTPQMQADAERRAEEAASKEEDDGSEGEG